MVEIGYRNLRLGLMPGWRPGQCAGGSGRSQLVEVLNGVVGPSRPPGMQTAPAVHWVLQLVACWIVVAVPPVEQIRVCRPGGLPYVLQPEPAALRFELQRPVWTSSMITAAETTRVSARLATLITGLLALSGCGLLVSEHLGLYPDHKAQ